MADTSFQPSQSSPAAGESPKGKQPQGYGRIARTWSRWSSNLLASGLVIVAAIGLLRYVAPWWNETDPPSSKEHLEETVGQGVATGHPLGVLSGFGDLAYSLRQAKYVGDLEGVASRLRQLCRQAVLTLPESNRKIGPAEQRMLDSLREAKPVEEKAGVWRMYEVKGPAPIVAVVPWNLLESGGRADGGPTTARGVLAWGIAVPAGDSNWTLFVYPGTGDDPPSIPGVPGLDLPAGTSRTVSLTGENGGAMMAFAGTADVIACRRHFDRWAASTDTPTIMPWRRIGGQWIARFGEQKSGRVDVHLFTDGPAVTGGFLSFSSAPDSAQSRK